MQADLLGERKSPEGIAYQEKVRAELELPVVDKKTILVMGGGEGVGSLSNIVNSLYMEFIQKGIDALILVVCGRNEKLKTDLEERDWDDVIVQLTAEKVRQSRTLSSFSFSNCVTSSTGAPPASKDVAISSSGCMDGSVTQQIKRILSTSSLKNDNALSGVVAEDDEENDGTVNSVGCGGSRVSGVSRGSSPLGNLFPMVEVDDDRDEESTLADGSVTVLGSVGEDEADIAPTNDKASVTVVGLGFVTKMADYMVAADVLVSKAGPGTIAEAASLSLPVMLTSFLPGQEEGNIDFVVDGGFGAFKPDSDPAGIAEEVAQWLLDDDKSLKLSQNAKKRGAPHAARDIVKSIGDLTLRWKKINDDRDRLNEAAEKLKLGIPSYDEGDEALSAA